MASPNGGAINGQFQNGQFQNGQFQNGQFQNGQFQNGQFQNGSSLVGWSLNASTLTDGSLGNVKLTKFWLNDGVIFALGKDGKVRSGTQLEGAKITGKLREDGTTITMTLEDVDPFTSSAGEPLQRAKIAFTIPGSGVTAYVCGKSANGTPIRAMPVNARWNYDQGLPGGGSRVNDPNAVTFMCEGYALYKCTDAGYHPWESWTDDHHQACVRLLRADYCGNGKPWTIDGTVVNMYDHIGIQDDSNNWPLEAEWDEDGAICLSHQRIQAIGFTPPCSFDKPATKCGKNIKWNTTLLVSEAQ